MYSLKYVIPANRSSMLLLLSEKCKDNINLIKVRLVAKGFEEVWADGQQKDSSTCLRESLHLIVMLAANNNWKTRCLGIKSSFQQEKSVQWEIFWNLHLNTTLQAPFGSWTKPSTVSTMLVDNRTCGLKKFCRNLVWCEDEYLWLIPILFASGWCAWVIGILEKTSSLLAPLSSTHLLFRNSTLHLQSVRKKNCISTFLAYKFTGFLAALLT